MQLSGLSIGIVADDMTGANDTALQFFNAGLPSQVLLNFTELAEAPNLAAKTVSARAGDNGKNQLWCVNTNSRHMEIPAAQAAVRQAVRVLKDQFGVENIYKKMDSTLRGHIAHEALAMLDELDADCVVIVPAYPQEGRQTVGGYQLVRGVPIERTPVVRDPLFPVRQSHIPTLLSQAVGADVVGYIPLASILHGAGPVLKELTDQIRLGKKIVVMDAASSEDLEQIALVIEKIQKTYYVIPCGSAGLAQALSAPWIGDAEQRVKTPLTLTPTPVLIVSGSNSETTRNQLRQLIEHYSYYGEESELEVFELPPDIILGLSSFDKLCARIVTALGSGGNALNTVILSISLKEDQYERTMALASEHQIPKAQVSYLAQEVLAKLTAAVVNQQDLKLVLIGGETAASVCRALDSQQMKIIAEAQPAIPLSVDNQGHWIITKSGNFGEPLVLANLVQFIKSHEQVAPFRTAG